MAKKLRIFSISDLHLEFYPKEIAVKSVLAKIGDLPAADVLVLAGDICDPVDKSDIYKELLGSFKSIYSNVILVPGNHEYYKTQKYDRDATYQKLKNVADDSGVLLLNNQSIIIERTKFIGTTLWTQIDPKVKNKLADFGRVYETAEQYNEEHRICFQWLKENLESDSDLYDNIVIVTHHIPSFDMCHPRFERYKELNTAFYSDILGKLNLKKVKLWFCGHTHESAVKEFKTDTYDMKIVINPLGYPKEYKLTKISLDTYDI
jgi:predicted MPP superfamily phosphohydrolase